MCFSLNSFANFQNTFLKIKKNVSLFISKTSLLFKCFIKNLLHRKILSHDKWGEGRRRDEQHHQRHPGPNPRKAHITSLVLEMRSFERGDFIRQFLIGFDWEMRLPIRLFEILFEIFWNLFSSEIVLAAKKVKSCFYFLLKKLEIFDF